MAFPHQCTSGRLGDACGIEPELAPQFRGIHSFNNMPRLNLNVYDYGGRGTGNILK